MKKSNILINAAVLVMKLCMAVFEINGKNE